jgi:hypothetical protein
VVLYNNSWYAVRAVFKTTVNLGSVFGSRTTVKGVPINEVKPDHDAWYQNWTQSETYKCM